MNIINKAILLLAQHEILMTNTGDDQGDFKWFACLNSNTNRVCTNAEHLSCYFSFLINNS